MLLHSCTCPCTSYCCGNRLHRLPPAIDHQGDGVLVAALEDLRHGRRAAHEEHAPADEILA